MALLFITAKNIEPPPNFYSLISGINKFRYDHGRGQYPEMKRNETCVHITRQTSPEAAMQRERSQPQRTMHLAIEDRYLYREIWLVAPQG